MRRKILRLAVAATLTLSGQVPLVTPAHAYPVDCAILLCLAGGWPASAPCAHARAEFIRRITPWPIEPPLQIWRCPMGASFSPRDAPRPTERLFEATLPSTLRRPSIPKGPAALEVQVTDGADLDISGEAFDFVRSIRVYHIQFRQRLSEDGECNRTDATRLGSYGLQGNFRWRPSSASQVPPASNLRITERCRNFFYRAVFVDWRDHAGIYGSEEVRY